MFISQKKTFHDAIKPLAYFNCFTGMGIFRTPNQSGVTYNLMKLYTLIVTVMTWAMIYITLNSMAGVEAAENTSLMAFDMLEVLVCANSSVTVIGPLLIRLRKKKVRDCVPKIVALDETLQSVFGAPNEHRQQYIRLICKIIVILVVMFMVIICDSVIGQPIESQLGEKSQLMFYSVAQTLHRPIAVMLVLDLNFCTFVGYLERRFRYLNESLLRLVEKPSTYCPNGRLFVIYQNGMKTMRGNQVKNRDTKTFIKDKHYLLREIRKARLELCKLSQKINLAFGIQNLLSTAVSFAMITGLFYTIYSVALWKKFIDSKFKEVFSSAVWSAIYVFKIWMVNHACWSVSNEAQKTGEVPYEFLYSKVDEELQKDIKDFGIQMLQNPVRFNACGFFTLDHTFVQGVIGSITTYLVILIQMSQVSESSTSEKYFPWNGSEFSSN